MDEEQLHKAAKQPWWNDQDKVGGLIATIVVLGILGFFIILLWGWAYNLAFK